MLLYYISQIHSLPLPSLRTSSSLFWTTIIASWLIPLPLSFPPLTHLTNCHSDFSRTQNWLYYFLGLKYVIALHCPFQRIKSSSIHLALKNLHSFTQVYILGLISIISLSTCMVYEFELFRTTYRTHYCAICKLIRCSLFRYWVPCAFLGSGEYGTCAYALVECLFSASFKILFPRHLLCAVLTESSRNRGSQAIFPWPHIHSSDKAQYKQYLFSSLNSRTEVSEHKGCASFISVLLMLKVVPGTM